MGSSPEAHLARTPEWPNPNRNPKPNPKPNPNPNPNHNPNTLTLTLTLTLSLKTILARCASGLDPKKAVNLIVEAFAQVLCVNVS